MIIPARTQSEIDSFDNKLDKLKAEFFLKLITKENLIKKFLSLGYGNQGAIIAANYLNSTGKLYREEHRKYHDSIYYVLENKVGKK